ncbi:MAG TPA: hypothetical protein DER22_06210 [Ruminococcus sp.]|nr:hypothetical protein [Ruminococcus sp.]
MHFSKNIFKNNYSQPKINSQRYPPDPPQKKPSFPNQIIKKGFAHTENLYNIFEVKHYPIERSFKMLIPKLFIQMKKQ